MGVAQGGSVLGRLLGIVTQRCRGSQAPTLSSLVPGAPSGGFHDALAIAPRDAARILRTVTEIARLSRDDWEIYRGARLAALEDAPSAFGSRLEDERQRSEAEWRDRLSHRTQFVARDDGRVLGTVGCRFEVADVAELVSMWVTPGARGSGVADRLVDAVLEHAREHDRGATLLWVSEGNTPAERLYARRGFVRTGATQPIDEHDPTRGMEFQMRRDER